jgi:hypothetical protein
MMHLYSLPFLKFKTGKEKINTDRLSSLEWEIAENVPGAFSFPPYKKWSC